MAGIDGYKEEKRETERYTEIVGRKKEREMREKKEKESVEVKGIGRIEKWTEKETE